MDDLKPRPSQQLFFSYITYGNLVPVNEGQDQVILQKLSCILLFTGIAYVYPLQEEVRRKCTDLSILKFPDHQHYEMKDLETIRARFEDLPSRKKIILTTEKDLMRLKNPEFSNGKTQVFLPVWVQKSWGKLTTYGGAGYCINPGTNNKNWIFTGAEIQYDISPRFMLGGELYYHSADTDGGKSVTACSIGGSINFSQKFHFIFSAGHSLINDKFTSSYVGLLLTI